MLSLFCVTCIQNTNQVCFDLLPTLARLLAADMHDSSLIPDTNSLVLEEITPQI